MMRVAGFVVPHRYQSVAQEHLWTRSQASLFDLSHLGQILIEGVSAQSSFETLIPSDLSAHPLGRTRYTILLNDKGGAVDDLMVSKLANDRLYATVNPHRLAAVLDYLSQNLPRVHIRSLEDHALLSLQGPMAATVLARFAPTIAKQPYMSIRQITLLGQAILVTRTGYTGEDGFELSIPRDHLILMTEALLAQPEIAMAGMGARDSLRLEAGYCLYGAELTESITPAQAGLQWVIAKERLAQKNFKGAEIIARETAEPPPMIRVGLKLAVRRKIKRNSPIVLSKSANLDQPAIGHVTSAAISPCLNVTIAMGYVPSSHAQPGQHLGIQSGGEILAAEVVKMPFVPVHTV